MVSVYKYSRFTEEEKARGINRIYLFNDSVYYGELRAEYIVPELGKVCGWWTPTLASVKDLENNWISVSTYDRYWVEVYYMTAEDGGVIERELIKSRSEKARAGINLKLGTWEIYTRDETNERQGGM